MSRDGWAAIAATALARLFFDGLEDQAVGRFDDLKNLVAPIDAGLEDDRH